MSELEYSDDALNTMKAFYRTTAIVYVEGDDDVIFWRRILAENLKIDLEIEPVGGVQEIRKYTDKILAGKIDAIVARDADLTHFVGPQVRHPRILYSYGYSIENSLYTTTAIKGLAESWSKTDKLELQTCINWANELISNLGPLIELDVANAIDAAGIETIGDNCTRFMTGTHSDRPCPNKIESYAKTVRSQVGVQALAAARDIVKESENGWRLIRGHFLASAIMKFIVMTAKKYGKKISLSAESLYAAAIAHFENAMKMSQHQHYEYYKQITAKLSEDL